MNWLHYLLEANIYLAVFYAGYCLFLNKETYYTLNRVYLLISCVVSFILPVVQVGILKQAEEPVVQTYATVIQNNYVQPQVSVNYQPEVSHFTLQDAIWYAYLLGIAVTALLLIIKIVRLIKMTRSTKTLLDDKYKLIGIDGSNTAFSFFNYLFIGSKTSGSDIIIRHELVHIRQRHSADIIFLEVIKIINWFNPFIYLIQVSLKTVHEYIADEQTAAQETDALSYSSFLVDNAYGLAGSSITHSFFNYNLLKKRIIMLNQKRSGNLARLKYLVAVPICAGMLCASTLAFSKNYAWVDLAPVKVDSSTDVQPQSLRFPPPIIIKNGYNAIYNHLSTTAKYPVEDLNNKQAGFVVVSFNVGADKKVSDVKIDKSSNTRFGDAVYSSLKSFTGTVADNTGEHKVAINFFTDYYAQAPAYQADIKKAGAELNMFIMSPAAKLPPPPPMVGKPKPNLPPPPAAPGHLKGTHKIPPPPPPAAPSNLKGTIKTPSLSSAFDDLGTYISKTAKYPAAAVDNNIQGNVYVKFTVNNDHKVSSASLIKGLQYQCGEDLITKLPSYPSAINVKPGTYHLKMTYVFAVEKPDDAHLFVGAKEMADSEKDPVKPDVNTVVVAYPKGKGIGNVRPPLAPPAIAPKVSKLMPPPPPPASPLDSLNKYIQRKTRYPRSAYDNHIGGRVILVVAVNNGKIDDVKLARPLFDDIDAELIRVVKGYDGPLPVKSGYYSLPVSFSLVDVQDKNIAHAPENYTQKNTANNVKNIPGNILSLDEVVIVAYPRKESR